MTARQHTYINGGWLAVIRVLAAISIAISTYLSWVTLTHGTIAACGDQHASQLACDDVLRSPWSRVVGIPVSLLGLSVYVTMFFTSGWLRESPQNQLEARKRLCCQSLVAIAFGAAVWFLFLQLIVIGHICLYCMAIHLSGITIGTIVIAVTVLEMTDRRRRSRAAEMQQLTLGLATPASPTKEQTLNQGYHFYLAASFGALLLMILLQTLLPSKSFRVVEAEDLVGDSSFEQVLSNAPSVAHRQEPNSVQPEGNLSIVETPPSPEVALTAHIEEQAEPPPRPSRYMEFLNGRLKLDVAEHGMLGSPDAECVIIELVDYTCPDCRRMHQQLKATREHFGDRFAIIVFPVPLETNCNPYIRSTHKKHVGACRYANLALSVLATAPNKFSTFHDWLMGSAEPPRLEEAVRQAQELVGLNRVLREAKSNQLEFYTKFFGRARIQRLPAAIVGDQVMVGVPKSKDDVIELIESELQSD